MAGGSSLGITRWLIAAEQPSHLTCMYPWKGLDDYCRESTCPGGIPDHSFWDVLSTFFCGTYKREDVSAMMENYPLLNDYQEHKKPKLQNITVPMYAAAS
ncbi:hypothetical protein E8E13_000324 [Curvularia kusanoi]|uniref:Uncharacterized protein n=1 Tax=Curvularia kusanoi TaxID=90978 RepID=A0A9P4W796_CURKU|nr:hypothetical protein E8E13_000324 [Curvularia kusanoi]